MLALFVILGVGAALFFSTRAHGYVRGVPTLISLKPVGDGHSLRGDAADSFYRLQEDAADVGIALRLNSGFRSMEEQERLYALYQAGTGNLAAKPGYSNHQSGIAADFANCQTFSTGTYRWLEANAHRYGWKNTGRNFSQPEPWHWEFLP